jgi:hypothetical protein
VLDFVILNESGFVIPSVLGFVILNESGFVIPNECEESLDPSASSG